MIYQQTTQVPNLIFDTHLPNLTESELKMLLIIIRQTNGWIDKRTSLRKTRDRISYSQFIQKTGLCRKVVSKTTQSLVTKGLIDVTDRSGQSLLVAEDRKGVSWIFYAFLVEPPRVKVMPLGIPGVRVIKEVLRRY